MSAANPARVLSVEGVAKRFGEVPAVRELGLEARDGEIHAVVGRSGCGKSTLLRLIAGLEVPDAGTVRIGDRLVAGGGAWVPPERRGVGMVFQDFGLFPHFTVLENVMYGLADRARPERESRAAEVLRLVSLDGLGGRYPHQLSGGQQQRVALARALAPEPALLLLDEPFSNLDTALKRELRRELGEVLRRAGITTILVVHDAEDVLDLADRVTVMRDGAVLQAGRPGELYESPRDAYVARIFGDANIVECRVVSGGVTTPLGTVECAVGGAPGETVRACIRPEDVQVSRDGPGRPATVRVVAGAGRSVLLELDDGHGTVTARAPEGADLSAGDRVFARVPAACVRLFPGG
ncbi:MAG: ABC transporter ATP-binding protein [Longimicrobiales bacterium]|nr:ABC transporter ATP-binding protein [Longimicrobiales bacterium]